MDRKAIRTNDQRQERIRLIEQNRQKRVDKTNDDEQPMAVTDKQIIVFIFSFVFKLFYLLFYLLDSTEWIITVLQNVFFLFIIK